MNIETKYLIRWGIPGWVFILFTYISYLSVGNNSIFKNGFTIPQLLGILISLGFVGVVLGYLMHQIYFSLNWIFTNQSAKIITRTLSLIDNKKVFNIEEGQYSQHESYYKIEFQWQKQLLLIEEEKRDYIAERYNYLLSTIHGLGALLVSLISSFFSVLFMAYNHTLNGLLIFFLALLMYLGFSVYKGFQYYSENLIYFRANFFNSLFKKEFTKPNREVIDLNPKNLAPETVLFSLFKYLYFVYY